MTQSSNTNNGKVSIVIPIYNTENYLRKCIQSTLDQTHRNLEIILIDDGSTDSSPQICKELAAEDNRVKVYRQNNKGVSAARNFGVRMSSGKFISFVDSDDTIDRTMIEALFKLITSNNCDMAVCGVSIISEGEQPIEQLDVTQAQVLSRDEALKDMLDEGLIANAPFGKMYKKEILRQVEFPEEITIGEDLYTNYHYLTKSLRVVVESTPRYFYLKRDGSAINRPFSPRRMDGLRATKEIFNSAKNQDLVVRNAARGRLFIEAIYILLSMPGSRSSTKFRNEYEECKKIVKSHAKYIAIDSTSRRRNRLYASVALANVDLLIRLLSFERDFRDGHSQKDRLKKVLVRHYSANNLGDDLFVSLMASRYKNKFSVILHTDTNSLNKLENVVVHKNWLMSRLTYYLDKSSYGRNLWLRALAKKNDLMVYIGGSIFMEGDSLKEWAYERRFYDKLKIPYYIMGANFGPYKTPQFVNIVRNIVSKATDVCFRDEASYRVFEDCDNTRVASDIVFTLDTSKYDLRDDKLVIFSIIDCRNRFDPKVSDRYEEEVIGLTKKFILEGYEIVYMSFCRLQGDEDAIYRILSKADEGTKSHIKIHLYRGDLQSALSLLARCEVVVGTRFHATILGLVFSKKILPIIYSDKTSEVLKDIGFSGPIMDLTKMDKFNGFKTDQLMTFRVNKLVTDAQHQFTELDKVLVKK